MGSDRSILNVCPDKLKGLKNQMKNEGARVGHNIIQLYFKNSSAANSVIVGRV